MVSKKSASISVKTTRIADSTPIRANPPNSEKSPTRPSFGRPATLSGQLGTVSAQPVGLGVPSAPNAGPGSAIASTISAMAVAARMPMRIAPRVLRATRIAVIARPSTNTSTGQPRRLPVAPSWTGTVPAPVRRTMPASTRPISARNRPMPTAIAIRSCAGMARNTATRKPVSTSTVITMPSITMRPIASAQDIRVATATARNAFSPSPGGQRDRHPTDDSHQDRHDRGHQRGRAGHLRDSEGAAVRVRRQPENQRVEHDDVRHGHERDHPAAHLPAHPWSLGR